MQQLGPGVHEIVQPLLVTGAGLSGATEGHRTTTRLRRGRRPDGSVFDGPLVRAEGCHAVTIRDLILEGARFAAGAGGIEDRRHPLTMDSGSPRFPCARRLPEPGCFQPSTFRSTVEPDIMIVDSSDVQLINVVLQDPISIGIAVARKTSHVVLRRCRVICAGDYGIWVGSGAEPDDPGIPLDPAFVELMPRGVRFEQCWIERCGAAGVFLDARDVAIASTRFVGNCHDAPYNDEGGQLTIDYKSSAIEVRDCVMSGAHHVVRRTADGGELMLGSFGIEVCGSGLSVHGTLIEGNSREGIQILGGRNVTLGEGTRIVNNHLIQDAVADGSGDARRFGVSISTTAALERLGAVADTILCDGVTCENGLVVWSDGSIPHLRLHRLRVRNSDLRGRHHSGVLVGTDPEGRSLQGDDWSLPPKGDHG